jgi:exopolysaccharide biosynthesis protein
VAGDVRAVHTDRAAGLDLRIEPGQLVLVADCDTGETLRRRAKVGSRVTVSFAARDQRLADADLAVTGVGWVLHKGKPHRANWKQYDFSTVRHPRTVVAWNQAHYFLVVIDGRSIESVGMTFDEMANFLTTVLNADEALNLDGGGSSAIVVDGTVKNLPSDGTERAVANALLLVRDAAHDDQR